ARIYAPERRSPARRSGNVHEPSGREEDPKLRSGGIRLSPARSPPAAATFWPQSSAPVIGWPAPVRPDVARVPCSPHDLAKDCSMSVSHLSTVASSRDATAAGADPRQPLVVRGVT